MEEEAKGVSGKQERAHPENTVSVVLSVMYLLRFSGLKCVFIKISRVLSNSRQTEGGG
jgi:hypothetical protein